MKSVDIAAETAGRVKEILFKDGQTVEIGAILFKFDDDLIRAAYDEASSRLVLAEANFKRNETLRKQAMSRRAPSMRRSPSIQLMRTAVKLSRSQTRQAHHPGALRRNSRFPPGLGRRLCRCRQARSSISTRSTG